MGVNDRIRQVLAQEKITDKTLADWLNMSAGRVSQKFKDGKWDRLGELNIIAEKTGYSLEWLYSGNGPEKGNAVAESEQTYRAIDSGGVYKKIVEGNTEYVLIPRSVLNEKYRLVSVEKIEKEKEDSEKDKRTIDRLLDQNEKLHDGLMKLLESQSARPQKTK